MESGIVSYQQYGSTEERGDFSNVAFQQPASITTQPHRSMEAPQQPRDQEQPLLSGEEGEAEDEFHLDCLKKLNRYLIVKCVPPKRRAKHYNVVTILSTVLAIVLCACCSLPCFLLAMHQSKEVKLLNLQGDYLSARSRSWLVVACNITGYVFIVLSDIAILIVIILIAKVIF